MNCKTMILVRDELVPLIQELDEVNNSGLVVRDWIKDGNFDPDVLIDILAYFAIEYKMVYVAWKWREQLNRERRENDDT